MILNEGLRFRHPLESYYNIYRRLVISNPAYGGLKTPTAIAKLQSHIKTISNASDVIFHNYLLQFTQDNHSLKPLNLVRQRNMSDLCVRQCPECARSVFHTNIFNYSWVISCPIHDTPLLKRCPNCNFRWRNRNEIHGEQCDLCGCRTAYDSHELRKRFNDTIGTELVDYFRIAGIFSETTARTISMSNDCYRREFMKINNPNSAGVVQATNKQATKAISSHIRLPKHHSHIFELVHILGSPVDSRHWNTGCPLGKCFSKIRREVAVEISNIVERIIGQKHRLKVSHQGIESWRCPYCIAFKYWFDSSTHQENVTTRAKYSDGFFSLDQKLNVLTPVPATHIVDIENNSYSTGMPFQLFYYRKELQQSYLIIYRYVCHVLKILRSQTKFVSSLSYYPLGLSTRVNNNLYHDFWLNITDNGKLLFVSPAAPILSEKTIPPSAFYDYNLCDSFGDNPITTTLSQHIDISDFQEVVLDARYSVYAGCGHYLASKWRNYFVDKIKHDEPYLTHQNLFRS